MRARRANTGADRVEGIVLTLICVAAAGPGIVFAAGLLGALVAPALPGLGSLGLRPLGVFVGVGGLGGVLIGGAILFRSRPVSQVRRAVFLSWCVTIGIDVSLLSWFLSMLGRS